MKYSFIQSLRGSFEIVNPASCPVDDCLSIFIFIIIRFLWANYWSIGRLNWHPSIIEIIHVIHVQFWNEFLILSALLNWYIFIFYTVTFSFINWKVRVPFFGDLMLVVIFLIIQDFWLGDWIEICDPCRHSPGCIRKCTLVSEMLLPLNSLNIGSSCLWGVNHPI